MKKKWVLAIAVAIFLLGRESHHWKFDAGIGKASHDLPFMTGKTLAGPFWDWYVSVEIRKWGVDLWASELKSKLMFLLQPPGGVARMVGIEHTPKGIRHFTFVRYPLSKDGSVNWGWDRSSDGIFHFTLQIRGFNANYTIQDGRGNFWIRIWLRNRTRVLQWSWGQWPIWVVVEKKL